MGAMHATRYAIDYTGDVTAIVAVSHSMDAEKSAKIVVSFHNFKNRFLKKDFAFLTIVT